MRRGILVALALLLAAASPASAKTLFDGVHAHRGGPNTGGFGPFPENSLEAFRSSHELGADVIELDAKLTADNVPVIIHDAALDRTTNCDGQVRQRNAADLAANCRIDTIGTGTPIRPTPGPGVAIPTLADVLAFAKANRVRLNLEIKNQPTDPDYDATPGFAQAVVNAVEASGIDKQSVLIQSFWFPNLDVAKAAGLPTSLLLLQQGSTQQGIDLARQNGYTVVSPGWPTAGDPKEFIENAHEAGLPVVPYTIDDQDQIARAFTLGADGVITNDTILGLQTRYGPLCQQARARERRLTKTYKKRAAAYRRERNVSRKRRLHRSLLSARRVLNRARRNAKTTCAKANS